MKNWLLSLLFFVCLIPSVAFAQVIPGTSIDHLARPLGSDSALSRAQFLLGMNISTFGGGDARLHLGGDKADKDVYWKGQMGLRSAILFEWNLKRGPWALETGLDYQVAGAYTGRATYSEEIEEGTKTHFLNTKAELHYLGMPLSMKYYTDGYRRDGLYVKAGLMPAFLVAQKFDVPNANHVLGIKSEDADETSGDKLNAAPFDVLLNIGAGLNFQVDSRWAIVLEGSLGHGILSVDPANQKALFNQSFGFVFGFSYLL